MEDAELIKSLLSDALKACKKAARLASMNSVWSAAKLNKTASASIQEALNLLAHV